MLNLQLRNNHFHLLLVDLLLVLLLLIDGVTLPEEPGSDGRGLLPGVLQEAFGQAQPHEPGHVKPFLLLHLLLCQLLLLLLQDVLALR